MSPAIGTLDRRSSTRAGSNVAGAPLGDVLEELYEVLAGRKAAMPEGSYTARLLAEGKGKICAKISEESGEVVAAALGEGHDRVVYETADLLYHLLVLLVSEDVALDEIAGELAGRRK